MRAEGRQLGVRLLLQRERQSVLIQEKRGNQDTGQGQRTHGVSLQGTPRLLLREGRGEAGVDKPGWKVRGLVSSWRLLFPLPGAGHVVLGCLGWEGA